MTLKASPTDAERATLRAIPKARERPEFIELDII